jgi:hypothetical protein
MSFDCPYFQNNSCVLQKGHCKPATGKCILKGKATRAKDVKNSEKK